MLRTLASAFRDTTVRRKLLFVAAILALYRLGSYIPTPDINMAALNHASGSGALGLFNLFSGGNTSRFCIFALGVMPYISASIIMQIMGVVVPKLDGLRKEGAVGEAHITQYTRYLTLGLSVVQAVGLVFLYRSLTSSSPVPLLAHSGVAPVIVIVCCLTGGAMLLMWLGEFITKRGIGQGVSLILLSSILSRLPHGIDEWWHSPDESLKIIMPAVMLFLVAAIVFIQEGVRRIPVQYARPTVGPRMLASGRTYLPLRVNMANVVPVIFASYLMAMPSTIGQLLHARWATGLAATLSPPHWQWMFSEGLLILGFCYFYTSISFNPVEQADNLKKYSAFIPGVRPGEATAKYLSRVMNRLTLPGAAYLAALAVLPAVFISQSGAGFSFGGTAVIIVVGVALDTVRRVEAELQTNSYDKFLE